jgi:hypothetical protein
MTPSHPRLDLLVRQLLLGVAVGRSCHGSSIAPPRANNAVGGFFGQKPNAGNVLVTAARRPVLTCAHHLGIRHWVPRRATRKHPACCEGGLPR